MSEKKVLNSFCGVDESIRGQKSKAQEVLIKVNPLFSGSIGKVVE